MSQKVGKTLGIPGLLLQSNSNVPINIIVILIRPAHRVECEVVAEAVALQPLLI